MKEITWEDDDVNSQSKFALRRAEQHSDAACWAGRLAERNTRRLESGEIGSSALVEMFRKLERDYLERATNERAIARLMWSS